MADIFFDLGLHLPQIDNVGIQHVLGSGSEVYEQAFTPGGIFEPIAPKRHIQFKKKRFDRMRFHGVTFRSITFRECLFDKCLLLSAKFEDCEFHECTFVACNTHKVRFLRTYIDPRSFVRGLFDRKRYSNVGIDLFQALLRVAVEESQPDFRVTAEYHFRLWQRYGAEYRWRQKSATARAFDLKFYLQWLANVTSQLFSGYGLRGLNILLSTTAFVCFVTLYNHLNWVAFDFDPEKMKGVSYATKLLFFTLGNLSTFGTAELLPRSDFGFRAITYQVVLGLGWIALTTAVLVRKVLR